MLASNNLTQKLIALAKTIAGWATELDKLNEQHPAKVAEYLDKVADTHARASAALSRRKKVKVEDIAQVAAPALRHRLRRDPLDETGSTARIARAVSETLG